MAASTSTNFNPVNMFYHLREELATRETVILQLQQSLEHVIQLAERAAEDSVSGYFSDGRDVPW